MREDKTKLMQEREELNTLIGKGVSFEVQDYEVRYKSYLWGLIKRKYIVPITREFRIEEPTLGTLDRLAAEWVEMAIDDAELKETDGLTQARILTNKHALRCAKVIAIAVMGADYMKPKAQCGGVIRYEPDEKRLEALTHLFERTIKPSELLQLYLMINAMCNFGDFLSSIRLMSANRTTKPTRIEESNVA